MVLYWVAKDDGTMPKIETIRRPEILANQYSMKGKEKWLEIKPSHTVPKIQSDDFMSRPSRMESKIWTDNYRSSTMTKAEKMATGPVPYKGTGRWTQGQVIQIWSDNIPLSLANHLGHLKAGTVLTRSKSEFKTKS